MAHGHNSDEKIIYVGDSRVRKHNHSNTPVDYSAYPGKSEAFIPNFLLKEWMVAVVVLVGILVLVMSDPAPLGYPADPTNTEIIPMPDWYFLFLYQLLKYPYTSGNFVILGTLGLPAIMFGGLLLAPFLDTGKERRFYRRPITASLMIVSLIACSYLTAFSWHHYTKELEDKHLVPDHIKRERDLEEARNSGKPAPSTDKKAALPPVVAADDPAMELFKKSTCAQCHASDLKGSGTQIPALLGVGDRHSKEEIVSYMKNGSPSGKMPPQWEPNKSAGMSDDDLNKIADWLSKQKKAQ